MEADQLPHTRPVLNQFMLKAFVHAASVAFQLNALPTELSLPHIYQMTSLEDIPPPPPHTHTPQEFPLPVFHIDVQTFILDWDQNAVSYQVSLHMHAQSKPPLLHRPQHDKDN